MARASRKDESDRFNPKSPKWIDLLPLVESLLFAVSHHRNPAGTAFQQCCRVFSTHTSQAYLIIIIGIRIEDVYCNKFHKEPYIMHHIYAQYFHPETLLERVRDVRFYR